MTTDFLAPATSVRAQPRLRLRSNEVADGARLRTAQRSAILGGGGLDVSPSLEWSGAPLGTLSYAVTAHDLNGRCYWAVADISGGVTSLVVDAGNGSGERLPSVARQLRNDLGYARYVGPAPAALGLPGRFIFAVHAVDVGRLPLRTHAGPCELTAALDGHEVGRATLTAAYGWSPPS
ncbi:PBP family phospholipid-binding protein [Williamsia limnetica]|uniref:PBP family phospholipid-binding protein n=1 Tax=Williamsia limnetica TaxID=882452 RepID=A0A318RLL1_WILLI|nr:YbhB/YbcL family Raf kinase inhibitor-like protein [Williamsia limnetica]PYE15163.1 PBP family phospholipid-binding protein [Williamsia limnetica]